MSGRQAALPEKTHETAVVIIPPDSVREPIQAIRRRYDRQIRRWMPHITMLYPFRPRSAFDAVAGELYEVCRDFRPFDIRLSRFHQFEHGRGRFTVWLAPEPADALRSLQAKLSAVVPDCNDVCRHRDGFTPHLSVGQVRGRATLRSLVASLSSAWPGDGVGFTVSAVSLIWRNSPPDDVFRVDRTVLIGG
jgi:2'-5' RNA ligase